MLGPGSKACFLNNYRAVPELNRDYVQLVQENLLMTTATILNYALASSTRKRISGWERWRK
jgi:hypothetical protein